MFIVVTEAGKGKPMLINTDAIISVRDGDNGEAPEWNSEIRLTWHYDSDLIFAMETMSDLIEMLDAHRWNPDEEKEEE